jgi:Thioesterase-like superfamily
MTDSAKSPAGPHPALPEAFYLPAGDGTYRATEATQGPWDPRLQHGGPPAALLAHAVEEQTGRPGMTAARVSIDFLGPVPVGEVAVRVKVVRPGRRVQLTEAELVAGDQAVAVARIWHHAVTGRTDGPVTEGQPAPPLPQPPARPLPEAGPPPGPGSLPETEPLPKTEPLPGAQPLPEPDGTAAPGEGSGLWGSAGGAPGPGLVARFGYGRALEWRTTSGSPDEPGPAAVWTRMRVPLVEGRPTTGLERMLVTADSANGASLVLPLDSWLSMPTSLTVTVLRQPEGEWVHMDARTHLAGDGVGLAEARLADEHGLLGVVAQPLLVAARG